MDVTRIHTDLGSHIEPPLDETWSDLDKLRWKAAVVHADCGVRCEVTPATLRLQQPDGEWLDVPGVYDVSIAGGSGGGGSFDDTWLYLNGVTAGARAVQQ